MGNLGARVHWFKLRKVAKQHEKGLNAHEFRQKGALLTWAKVVSKSSTPHVNGTQPKRHVAQMDAPP